MKRASVSKCKAPVADPLAPVRETFRIKDPRKVEEYFGIVERNVLDNEKDRSDDEKTEIEQIIRNTVLESIADNLETEFNQKKQRLKMSQSDRGDYCLPVIRCQAGHASDAVRPPTAWLRVFEANA